MLNIRSNDSYGGYKWSYYIQKQNNQTLTVMLEYNTYWLS